MQSHTTFEYFTLENIGGCYYEIHIFVSVFVFVSQPYLNCKMVVCFFFGINSTNRIAWFDSTDVVVGFLFRFFVGILFVYFRYWLQKVLEYEKLDISY